MYFSRFKFVKKRVSSATTLLKTVICIHNTFMNYSRHTTITFKKSGDFFQYICFTFFFWFVHQYFADIIAVDRPAFAGKMSLQIIKLAHSFVFVTIHKWKLKWNVCYLELSLEVVRSSYSVTFYKQICC